MSVFKREKPGNDAPAANPNLHEDAEHHHSFFDWLPLPAQPHAPSLAPYVDDDLHKQSAPAPAAAPTAASEQGRVYAAMLSGMADTTNDHQQHYQILNMLESVTDPAVRHEMMKQFHDKTGKSLDDFLAHQTWDGKRDKDEALALISPERDAADAKLAAMPEEKKAALRKEAMAVAKTIDSTQGKDDAGDKENARKVADALADKSPEEVEAIRAAIQTTTHGHQGTYELLDRSLSGGKEDEAVAALRGDKVHTASVGLANARNDPKRAREILDRLKPEEIAELSENTLWKDMVVASMPESERKEIELRLSGNRAAADADRISSLLKDPKDAWEHDMSEKRHNKMDIKEGLDIQEHAQDMYEQRKPENIIRELEKMSPKDLQAARAAYDPKEHGGKTWDQMIGERFDDKDVDGKRVAALLRGDMTTDKALELREGMRTHNQDAIEHALSNEDLASKDPERHARGVAEKNELEALIQKMDAPAMPSWMAAAGVPQKQGRTLEKQLDDSNKDYLDGKLIDPDNPFSGTGSSAPIWRRDKREDEVKDRRIAEQDLLSTGKLSLATEMYRARDSAGQRADLLDETKSNSELAEAKSDYKEKYGKEMLAGEDLRKYEFLAMQRHMDEMMHGKDRPLEDIEREIAMEQRDVNEQRIEQTRTEGVRTERNDDQLRHDEHEIYDKQYSGKLEKVEQQREYWGGGIGSQHIWRENIEAMDAQAPERTWWGGADPDAAPAKTELVHQLDEVAGADQATAREEKIKLAESQAKIFTTIARLGSFAVGGPVATAIFNGLVGVAGAQMKKSIGGEAIDMGKEYKEVGVDFVGDLATMGMNGELSEAKEMKEAEELLKEGKTVKAVAIEEGRREAQEKAAQKVVGTAAGKILTTEAQDKLVKDKSDHDTAADVMGVAASQFLPGLFGGKVEHALGKTHLDEGISKGIGTVTEKVTDKAIEGTTEAGNTDEKKKELAKKRAEEAELEKQKAEVESKFEREDG